MFFLFVFVFSCFCFFRLMACGILTYGCLIFIAHSKLLFSIFCLVAFWTYPISNLPATAANRLNRKFFFAFPHVFQFIRSSTSWNMAKSSSPEYEKVSWQVIWLPRMWKLLRAWCVCQINKIIERFSIFLQVKFNYLCAHYFLEMPLRGHANKFQLFWIEFWKALPAKYLPMLLMMLFSTLVVVCAGRAINIHRLLITSVCGQKLMLQLRL